MINELLNRRGLLMSSGSAIDWEAILSAVITGDTGVDEFVFPSGVTKLRQYGLCRTKFKSVTIPNTVRYSTDREISFLAENTALTHIDFGSGLERIDENFCYRCIGLTTVTIPSQIIAINYRAFCGCSSLSELIVEPTTPPSLGQLAFANTALTAIYVPDASVSTYQSAANWSTYASIIKPISQRPT